jgi:hypothetical protein
MQHQPLQLVLASPYQDRWAVVGVSHVGAKQKGGEGGSKEGKGHTVGESDQGLYAEVRKR